MSVVQIMVDPLDTMQGPTITCYEVEGDTSSELTTNGIVPNDGRGKKISCIVEYTPLGEKCNPGYYQPSRGSPCEACSLDYHCPGDSSLQRCLLQLSTQPPASSQP
jgi:hypothetical protein